MNSLAGSSNDYLGSHSKSSESDYLIRPIQMGARLYIPELGRFLQVDPVDGGCVNAYVYVLDPVNQRDLNGKFIWFAIALVSITLSVYNAVQDPSPLNIAIAVVDIATAGIGSKVIAGLKIVKEVANVAADVARAGSSVAKNGSRTESTFTTFNSVKKTIGSPGEGNQWHHVVEQSQINKSGFSSQVINNPNNLVAIDKATHAKISGYYTRTSLDFTDGLSVRNYLSGRSFEEQYQFGLDVIEKFK